MTEITTQNSTTIKALVDSLNWRYATKKFNTEKKIEAPQVEALLEVLRLAPSSMGLQPYRFVHVTDAEVRKQLQKVSMNQQQITDASELIVFAAKERYTERDIDAFLDLSKQVRGFSDEALSKRRKSISDYIGKFEEGELVNWTSRQLYIAMGMLLSAAALMGIDACPMEGIKGEEYDEILGLKEENLKTFAVVTLGYRSSNDDLADKTKIRFPKNVLIKAH